MKQIKPETVEIIKNVLAECVLPMKFKDAISLVKELNELKDVDKGEKSNTDVTMAGSKNKGKK